MPWGQVVIGPPGCGKTTYCAGMANLLELLGRKTIVVNLAPANESLPYTAAVDIAKVITEQQVELSHPSNAVLFISYDDLSASTFSPLPLPFVAGSARRSYVYDDVGSQWWAHVLHGVFGTEYGLAAD